MYKRAFIATTIVLFVMALPAMAGKDHDAAGHGATDADHATDDKGGHGGADSEHATDQKGFKHQAVVDGIRAEFQVMSLASMKMDDTDGDTHHIMVKFVKEGMDHKIDSAVGKIKLITPSKKEQTNALKNYGGIMAANFTFTDKGKYGVICLFKVDGKKHVVKFWYPHHG